MRGSCFWEDRRFLTKYGHESNVFFREFTFFLTKYGHESIDFFVKNREKNGILLTLLAHKQYSFDRIYIFLTKFGHENRGFFIKILKQITLEHCVFERMDVLLPKYGHESILFFKNGRFFDKIWAWEQIFFVENRKKCILLTVLAHNIV